jgi:hypothetical protein
VPLESLIVSAKVISAAWPLFMSEVTTVPFWQLTIRMSNVVANPPPALPPLLGSVVGCGVGVGVEVG